MIKVCLYAFVWIAWTSCASSSSPASAADGGNSGDICMTEDAGGSCRSSEDCENEGDACFPMGTTMGECGGFCPDDVRGDAQCCEKDPCTGADEVCITTKSCGCCFLDAFVCKTNCNVDTSVCAPDEWCGEDGICVQHNCATSDLITCSSIFDCNPEDFRADAQGCVAHTCENDGDCACGFCLQVEFSNEGRCSKSLGFCAFAGPTG